MNEREGFKQLAEAITSGLRQLGNADASTPMGAIEAHGKATIDGLTMIAESLERVADSLQEVAEAISNHGESKS